jgi:hypothetical protein
MTTARSSYFLQHPGAIFRLLIGVVCLIVLPLAVFSQTTAGLTGAVTDSSGAVMPGTKVTLTSTETGVQREVATNESGIYEFTPLQPGTYMLTLQKEGFAQFSRRESGSRSTRLRGWTFRCVPGQLLKMSRLLPQPRRSLKGTHPMSGK